MQFGVNLAGSRVDPGATGGDDDGGASEQPLEARPRCASVAFIQFDRQRQSVPRSMVRARLGLVKIGGANTMG